MRNGDLNIGTKDGTSWVLPVRGGSDSAPAAVARTGRTASLQAGDDGDLQHGVAWPDPRFADFMRQAADVGSIDLNPWMTFDSDELRRAEFLRIRCRKTVADTPADFTRMREAVDTHGWNGADPRRRAAVAGPPGVAQHLPARAAAERHRPGAGPADPPGGDGRPRTALRGGGRDGRPQLRGRHAAGDEHERPP